MTIKLSVQLLTGSSRRRWFPIVLQKVGADIPHEPLGLFNRNYAAGLATAAPKWFWDPLHPGKIPKVSVLEAEFSCWGIRLTQVAATYGIHAYGEKLQFFT